MAGRLVTTDPALAYRHAEAARRRASRLPVTREATGEAAYAAGEYAVALAEFRALRRMNGGNEFVPAMADCERALGNPDKALKLVQEGLKGGPDFATRVELKLVEAGCRRDLEQRDEALRLLRTELESAGGRGTRAARARLRYGYANLLEEAGDTENAERWFAAAAALDLDGETDAAERVEALQGLVIDIDEDDLVGDEPAPADTTEGPSADDDPDDEDAAAEDADDDAAENDVVPVTRDEGGEGDERAGDSADHADEEDEPR